MSLRLNAACSDHTSRMVLLARDPGVIEAARAAARDLGRASPLLIADGQAALAQLFSPGGPPRQLICEPSAAGSSWPALLATATDPFAATGIVVVAEDGQPLPAGVPGVRPEVGLLTEALRRAAQVRRQIPAEDPAALSLGLARGEITVRYQPAVEIASRRPVLLEGLARWQRRDESALSPDAFVPLAERNGLSRALSVAVARSAFAEMASRAARVGATLSMNLPLPVLVERDVLGWLERLRRGAGFPIGAVALELTETMPVRDRGMLRRSLIRLAEAGYPVLIDDMGLEEDRAGLLDLPFAGIKLDRHLISAMPASRRARAEVARLVQMAHARRMRVTAEGVSDSRLWRAVAAAGADNAQGYAIARPLPAAALPGWAAAWKSGSIRRAPRQIGGDC
jgi:EAL domain-containing protein (putative c-di-GMP-specific phosphodiesterase class I)